MTYLFGDSTPSAIRVDYIDFLRRSLRAFADTLIIERRIVAARDRRRSLQEATAQRRRRLEQMRDQTCRTARELARDSGDDAALRWADTVVRSARDAAADEIDAATTQAEREESEALEDELRHRAACIETLEPLLLRFDLPASEPTVRLTGNAHGGYDAHLDQHADYAVTASFELSIPEQSPFTRELKVQAFAPDLEIHSPESGGWLRKEPRIVRHKVGKLHIVEVVTTPETVRIDLRHGTAPDADGYRLSANRTDASLHLEHVRKDSTAPEPFDVAPEDAPALEAFAEQVARAADELIGCRARLSDLRLDGASLTDSSLPSAVMERAVAAMAPVVREIREHSVTPGELVLRRTIDHNRREESFVTVDELAELLGGLRTGEQAIFMPLALTSAGSPPTNRSDEPPDNPRNASEPSMEIEPSMIVDDGVVTGATGSTHGITKDPASPPSDADATGFRPPTPAPDPEAADGNRPVIEHDSIRRQRAPSAAESG